MLDMPGRIQDGNLAVDAPDAAGAWHIWPGDGIPPGSEGWTWQERTARVPWSATPRRYARNVVAPTVTIHRPPAGRGNGTALIVAPGGAFHFLMIEHEGHEMARWLVERGITALVLKYRLMRTPDNDDEMEAFRRELQPRLGRPTQTETEPPGREFMRENRLLAEEDGRQAIRFVRTHAASLGIDPGRIGIAGFSAGGGVAMAAAMQHDAASRPDFVVSLYPAWRRDLTVPHNAPPLFLAISDDDMSIAPISSSRLYQAWHASGAPVELHVFGNGGHGWGMTKAGILPDIWTTLLDNWLRSRDLL